MVGLSAFIISNATFEQRKAATDKRSSPGGKAEEPPTSKRNPESEQRTAKNDELMNDQDRPGRKKKSRFCGLERNFPLSSKKVLISSPSFSQFTSHSLFPYHRL